jgi:hypothetical protein
MIFFNRYEVISRECEVLSIKNFFKINKRERELVDQNILLNYIHHISECGGYNFPIEDNVHPFFPKLYKKYFAYSKKIFKDFKTIDAEMKYWCYMSSPMGYKSIFHNHKKSSTINGVYYYQINNRDSISFLDDKEKEFKYYPKEGELLIFPNYRIHKPNPPVFGKKIRYSINLEIMTQESSKELFNKVLC